VGGARRLTPSVGVHHGGAVPKARTLTSRALAVHDLPPATATFLRDRAAQHDLGDPLAEVTHGLRSDEEITKKRPFGAPRTTSRQVEMLLTPELLIVVDHEADQDRVGFHSLDQLEFTAAPAELLAKVTGMPVDVPDEVMPMTSTPIGGGRRTTRYVRLGTGPDVRAFRQVLRAAVERARPGAGA
jgi:hypothetical protein